MKIKISGHNLALPPLYHFPSPRASPPTSGRPSTSATVAFPQVIEYPASLKPMANPSGVDNLAYRIGRQAR